MRSLILFLVYFFFINCSDISNIDKEYFRIMSKDNCSTGISVIIPLSKTEVLIGENDILRDIIYKDNYSSRYKTYRAFLKALYSNPKLISKEEQNQFSYRYFLNKGEDIYREYKEIGIEAFINKYMVRDGKVLNLDSILDDKTSPMILKIMFDNGYYIHWTDYEAHYFFTKEKPFCTNLR